MSDWKPTASLLFLQKRAEYLQKIRAFFNKHKVLEVETPILSQTSIPDPFIESIETKLFDKTFYLQTSPEFHMKRLLASGCGDIYQIFKAFRDDEVGQYHNPEFTMLEWYRIGFSLQDLMKEVSELMQWLMKTKAPVFFSYEEIFLKMLDINPLEANAKDLEKKARTLGLEVVGLKDDDKDGWLNCLMSHFIEPKLCEKNQPYFIYNFPVSQASLAKICDRDDRVAQRFELYFEGLELANGFKELTCAKEQCDRFQKDLQKRQTLGLKPIVFPAHLIDAVSQGLPECAGVALGLDRLFMIMLNAHGIEEVLSFSIVNA